MFKLSILFCVLCFVLLSLSGCLSREGMVRVDDLMGRIIELEKESKTKIEAARAGDLSILGALEFVKLANEQISKLREEASQIKADEGASNLTMILGFIGSIIGSTGIVRAWRGKSHKNITATL